MSVDELKNSWSAIADIGGKDMVFREAIATVKKCVWNVQFFGKFHSITQK